MLLLLPMPFHKISLGDFLFLPPHCPLNLPQVNWELGISSLFIFLLFVFSVEAWKLLRVGSFIISVKTSWAGGLAQ